MHDSTDGGTPREIEPGTFVGPYEIRDLLGKGGVGNVYRAIHEVNHREIALKIPAGTYAGDELFRQRFLREAQVAARLASNNIVPIYAFGQIGDRLYVEMELIHGNALSELVQQNGPLEPAAIRPILSQIAAALDIVHREKVVHRDVKPSNIMVDRLGAVWLIDFGSAHLMQGTRLTPPNSILGTFEYTAPECFRSRQVDYRCDIYSLAVLLFELLTGRTPFAGQSLEQLMHSHMRASRPKPSQHKSGISSAIDHVVLRGMSVSPEDRFDSAIDMANAFALALRSDVNEIDKLAAIRGRGIARTTKSYTLRGDIQLRRRAAVNTLVGEAVLATSAFLAIALWLRDSPVLVALSLVAVFAVLVGVAIPVYRRQSRYEVVRLVSPPPPRKAEQATRAEPTVSGWIERLTSDTSSPVRYRFGERNFTHDDLKAMSASREASYTLPMIAMSNRYSALARQEALVQFLTDVEMTATEFDSVDYGPIDDGAEE